MERGYKEPQTYVLEHGYCRSVYVTDPDDTILEFTFDNPEAEVVVTAPDSDCRPAACDLESTRRTR